MFLLYTLNSVIKCEDSVDLLNHIFLFYILNSAIKHEDSLDLTLNLEHGLILKCSRIETWETIQR